MNRECLRLLAAARSGDHRAKRAVAEHYLRGTAGFPKHLRLGVEYLSNSGVKSAHETSLVISQALSLVEILNLGYLHHLQASATYSDGLSLLKLAAWNCVSDTSGSTVLTLIKLATDIRAPHAEAAMQAWTGGDPTSRSERLLRVLSDVGLAGDPGPVALHAVQLALQERDFSRAMHGLRCLSAIDSIPDSHAAHALNRVLVLARELNAELSPPPPSASYIQSALELLATEGDRQATFILGRGLCGLPWGPLAADAIVSDLNLRRGTALLLRAADGGCGEAWTDLYLLHSRARSSVANPSLAVFCLEKAAAKGRPGAQLRLGTETLRQATTVQGFELGISWLHHASLQGDVAAQQLLASLVFPVSGSDGIAESGLRLLHQRHPWMAARLRVARYFGLTRAEALTFCPVTGGRPWGLVVGCNPFVGKGRSSSARAVPAVNEIALRSLNEAILLFSSMSTEDPCANESLLRQRSFELGQLINRLCLNESFYFARPSSAAERAMKLGPRWAWKNRELVAEMMSRDV